MHVLLAGGTGFIGQELGIALTRAGHTVTVLSRRPERYEGQLAFPARLLAWQPGFRVAADTMSTVDAVICLTGASIADTSWNKHGKETLYASRIEPTTGLMQSIKDCAENKPSVFLQASATGYYGDRGDDTLTEDSAAGEGFLADLSSAWEGAASENVPEGVRLVVYRIPPVLGRAQGLLKTLDKAYSPGIVPKLGSGEQWFSWIHIDDLVAMVASGLTNESLSGAVNAVSPEPVKFAAFHTALSNVKGVTDFGRMPGSALKVFQGEKSTLVLNSVRSVPAKMQAQKFVFKFASVDDALDDIYGAQREANTFWLEEKQWVPKSIAEIWPFFSDAKNLEKLTPEWLNFKVLGISTEDVTEGTNIDYRLKLHGIPLKWRSVISEWHPGKKFVDQQVKGPYKVWHHTHTFEELAGGTLMTDTVQFKLPFKALGLIGVPLVEKDVTSIFNFRKEKVKEEFYEADRRDFAQRSTPDR